MTRLFAAAVTLSFLLLSTPAPAAGGSAGFSPYVDDKGEISLPKAFRTKWVHLGSWAVPAQTDPGSGFHDVYTQPESVEYYMKNGGFPDGAVIVKEIRKAEWREMTTGHVVSEGDVDTTFVMVRDEKGRFKDSPNWGDGWGWGLFKASDPSKNASANYREDCIPCHLDAKDTGWVYVEGYPTLRSEDGMKK